MQNSKLRSPSVIVNSPRSVQKYMYIHMINFSASSPLKTDHVNSHFPLQSLSHYHIPLLRVSMHHHLFQSSTVSQRITKCQAPIPHNPKHAHSARPPKDVMPHRLLLPRTHLLPPHHVVGSVPAARAEAGRYASNPTGCAKHSPHIRTCTAGTTVMYIC